MELREQFTLAPGVSQSMTSFKPKTSQQQKVESPNSSVSGQGSRNPSTSGPITKVNKQTKLGFFINFALVFEYFYYQSERRSKHQPSGDNCHPWCFHVFFLWKRQGDIFIFPTKCIGILGKITKCDSCPKIWCFFVFSPNLQICCP